MSKAQVLGGDRDTTAWWVLAVALFMDAVALSMLAPVLPALQRRIEVTDVLASLLYSGYSIGLMGGFLLGALMVRHFSVRNLILGALATHVGADLIIALSASGELVATARVSQGVASGVLWIAGMAGTVSAAEPRRMIRIARFVSIYWLGSVLGPAMGMLGGVTRPFLLHAAITAALLIAVAVRIAPTIAKPVSWGNARAVRQRPVLAACAWIALIASTQGIWHGSYSLLFGRQLSQIGLVLLFGSMGLAAAGAALLMGRVRDVDRTWQLVYVSVATTGMAMAAAGWLDLPTAWFVALVVSGAATGVGESGTLALVSRATPAGLLAALVAYTQSWSLGYLVGPTLGTTLASNAGWLAPGLFITAAAFLFVLTIRVNSTSVGPSSDELRP